MKEIKLKEIKPGMVIHYKNDEEKKLLLEELERLGYVWYETRKPPTEHVNDSFIGDVIFTYNDRYKNITHSTNLDKVTHEFSDLILPELSTEEIVEWMVNNYYKDGWEKCFGRDYALDGLIDNFDTKEIIDRITNYISDHEKKKPEIEWVDVCRIIQIQDNGTKKCVYEEEIRFDEEVPYGSEKLKAEEIFNNYIAEHDGNYIAVIEPVLKVKGE